MFVMEIANLLVVILLDMCDFTIFQMFDSLWHTHSVGDSEKGYIRLIEQGAFCDVHKMKYSDGKLQKPQKMGFAIVCQDKDGNLIKNKTKVVVLD